MKKLKMIPNQKLTFEEGCNKYSRYSQKPYLLSNRILDKNKKRLALTLHLLYNIALRFAVLLFL